MKTLTKENKGFHYINIMDQGVYIDMVTGSVIQNPARKAIPCDLYPIIILKRYQTNDRYRMLHSIKCHFCGSADVLYRNYAKRNLLVGTRTWSGNACG